MQSEKSKFDRNRISRIKNILLFAARIFAGGFLCAPTRATVKILKTVDKWAGLVYNHYVKRL
jgi:hypothetical protein